MTSIEWTNKSLNLWSGCTKVSPGCENCYAETMSVRQASMEKTIRYGPSVKDGKWSNEIHIHFDEKLIMKPLEWKKPCMIFVNSMSDTFHEKVPVEALNQLFLTMALCSNFQKYDKDGDPLGDEITHTFQILTKRPERALEYLTEMPIKQRLMDAGREIFDGEMQEWLYFNLQKHEDYLPNVWLGVTAENQSTADERIPLLLKTPAAVRFVSFEPALEEINFGKLLIGSDSCEVCHGSGFAKNFFDRYSLQEGYIDLTPCPNCLSKFRIHWLICGGESGPRARPMHPKWARLARDQCKQAGIPFFFKQWGSWCPAEYFESDNCTGHYKHPNGKISKYTRGTDQIHNWDEPNKNYPEGKLISVKMSKGKSGRMLDGEFHDAFPNIEKKKRQLGLSF